MYKVCIISCGMIANSAHLPAYKELGNDFEVVGVCDNREESAKQTAEKWGIKNYFTDAEEMLKVCKPDVVSVCSPNSLHKRFTMLALSYGANVICEKPLATKRSDALEVYAYAKEQGKVLMACQSVRFTSDKLAAKKYINANPVSDFYYMEIARVRRRGIPYWGKFHIKEFSGGGAFLDIGIHMLDAVVFLSGNVKVKSVLASASMHHADEIGDAVKSGAFGSNPVDASNFKPEEMNVEDFSAGTVTFENGAVLNFKVTWATNLPDEASIKLVSKEYGLSLPDCSVYTGYDGKETLKAEEGFSGNNFSGHHFVIKNMKDVLEGKAELIVKPEEVIATATIIELFYRSVELKREVFVSELNN